MKKNVFKKLSTTIIVAIVAMMMVTPSIFANEVTAICGEVPSEDSSPEYAVIYNPDTGEEMDEAAISIGLPTREEIAQNAEEIWANESMEGVTGEAFSDEGQIGIWPLIDRQIEEAIQANPGADPREIANEITYDFVGDEYAAP